MVPAGKKAKCLSLVNHTIKKIIIILRKNSIIILEEKPLSIIKTLIVGEQVAKFIFNLMEDFQTMLSELQR